MYDAYDMVAQYVLFVVLLSGLSLGRRHGGEMCDGNVGAEPEPRRARRRPRRRRLKEVDGYVVLVAAR